MKGSSRESRLSRILVLIATLGVALCVFMFRDALWTRVTGVMAASEEDPVPVSAVKLGGFAVTIPADGEITGLQSRQVRTPQTRSGALTIAWMIPEGSLVKAGDPVVRFDSIQATLNLEEQKNALAANKQRLRIMTGQQQTDDRALGLDIADARKDYEYSMNVLPVDETIFSRWDIIEAKIDAAFAKERTEVLARNRKAMKRIARSDRQILAVEKQKAETEAAIAQQTLDELELDSPVSGLVLYHRERGREPQIGDQCWRGQILVEVVNIGSLQARINVLERDAGGLVRGKEVTIRLDSLPEKTFKGVLQSVAPLAQPLDRDSPLRYFICDARIGGAAKYLKSIRPGMAVEAEIVLERYDSCFAVPESAVTRKGSENLVYIRRGEDFVTRSVEIAPGPHGQTVVLNGIKDGEIVALKNPHETRKAFLPDFSKASANMDSRSPGRRRIRFH
jgi:multidrug efflux pump subunit AcrA (membrane-fusion protein)